MKFLFSALLLIVIFSCKQNKKESIENKPAPPPPTVTAPVKENRVETYSSFINKLDTTKVESVSTAAKQFDKLFSNSDTTHADSGFVVFSNFFDTILNYINEQHIKDPTDYTAYVSNTMSGKGKKTALADAYINTLRENGFTIDMTEGNTYIKQDRRFLSKYFYPHVSATMKEYLVQVNKENEEGFIEDAGLQITPTVLGKRILFWESFLKNHPAFTFNNNIRENQRGYTTFLLEGFDNSPVIDNNTKKISADYKAAFDNILTTAPQSKLAGLVRPYYDALRKNDSKTAKSLLLKYKKEGIIYDYTA